MPATLSPACLPSDRTKNEPHKNTLIRRFFVLSFDLVFRRPSPGTPPSCAWRLCAPLWRFRQTTPAHTPVSRLLSVWLHGSSFFQDMSRGASTCELSTSASQPSTSQRPTSALSNAFAPPGHRENRREPAPPPFCQPSRTRLCRVLVQT